MTPMQLTVQSDCVVEESIGPTSTFGLSLDTVNGAGCIRTQGVHGNAPVSGRLLLKIDAWKLDVAPTLMLEHTGNAHRYGCNATALHLNYGDVGVEL